MKTACYSCPEKFARFVLLPSKTTESRSCSFARPLAREFAPANSPPPARHTGETAKGEWTRCKCVLVDWANVIRLPSLIAIFSMGVDCLSLALCLFISIYLCENTGEKKIYIKERDTLSPIPSLPPWRCERMANRTHLATQISHRKVYDRSALSRSLPHCFRSSLLPPGYMDDLTIILSKVKSRVRSFLPCESTHAFVKVVSLLTHSKSVKIGFSSDATRRDRHIDSRDLPIVREGDYSVSLDRAFNLIRRRCRFVARFRANKRCASTNRLLIHFPKQPPLASELPNINDFLSERLEGQISGKIRNV